MESYSTLPALAFSLSDTLLHRKIIQLHFNTLLSKTFFLAADDSKNFKILKYKDDRLGGKSLIQRRGSDPMNERYLCRQRAADLVMV